MCQRTFILFLIGLPGILLLEIRPLSAQQSAADSSEIPAVEDPAYRMGAGPLVCVDAGHNNFHTLQGGFAPFGLLLERDGYRLESSEQTFGRGVPGGCSLLVIANALHERNAGNWTLPTPSAFTPGEIKQVQEWVDSGGSLLLIADHMPFPGAAADLAEAFGFTFNNGFALKQVQTWPPAVFSRADGTLKQTPVTADIDSVASYTGQAFRIPVPAIPVLEFGNDHYTLMPDTAWQFSADTPQESVEGWSQGALMQYGEGRVAVFGEAAMFTAQVAGEQRQRVGFIDPAAPQNVTFLRNLIHWLDPQMN